MEPHVQGKRLSISEALIAREAHRRRALGRSLVLPQVLALDERAATVTAGEGAFPCVQANVVPQVTGVEEALAANRALVRPPIIV